MTKKKIFIIAMAAIYCTLQAKADVQPAPQDSVRTGIFTCNSQDLF